MKDLLRSFLKEWFVQNGRSFPWRQHGVTPFHILVTEMLLRQTKAESVAAIWQDFVRQYGTPWQLSHTSEAELSSFLSCLGLHVQRAKALRECAMFIQDRYQGNVPRSLPELLKIPHVGLYTAHATMCFAFKERYPVVDANVIRILGRFFALGERGDLRRRKAIWDIAWDILPWEEYVEHNYALLDFGAMVCKSRGALCKWCGLRESCRHVQNNYQKG